MSISIKDAKTLINWKSFCVLDVPDVRVTKVTQFMRGNCVLISMYRVK